jgi:putative inorganic carbon (hco3(-)) transporter
VAEALGPGLQPVSRGPAAIAHRPWEQREEEAPPAPVEEPQRGLFAGFSRLRDRPGLTVSLFFSTLFGFAYYIDVTPDGKAMLLTGALLAAAAFAAAVFAPRIFPLVAIAYLPFCKFYPLEWDGLPPGNMTNVVILAGALAWVVARVRGRAVLPFDWFDLALLAWIGCAFLASVRTHDLASEATISGVTTVFKWWITPLVFYYFARGVLEDRDDVIDMMVALCWVAALVGALTWREGVNIGDRGSIDASRVSGLMRQANNMGAFLVYYGVPMFGLALSTKTVRNRLLYMGGFLLTARATLFTFSRGAYLATVAGVASATLMTHPVYVAVGSVVAGVAYMNPELIPESVAARMGSTVKNESTIYDDDVKLDDSNEGRIILWMAAVAMIEDNPLRGVGIGRFPVMVDQYTEVPLSAEHARDAHNAFLLTAAEMGLPGAFSQILCLFWLGGTAVWLRFKGTHALDRRLGIVMAGVIGGVIVSCLFGSRFSDECLIGCFWVLAGTMRALVVLERQEAGRRS